MTPQSVFAATRTLIKKALAMGVALDTALDAFEAKMFPAAAGVKGDIYGSMNADARAIVDEAFEAAQAGS